MIINSKLKISSGSNTNTKICVYCLNYNHILNWFLDGCGHSVNKGNHVNSLWQGDVLWRYRFRSILAQSATGQHQAVFWIKNDLLRPIGSVSSEILIKYCNIQMTEMHFEKSSSNWWKFCEVLNMLKITMSSQKWFQKHCAFLNPNVFARHEYQYWNEYFRMLTKMSAFNFLGIFCNSLVSYVFYVQ